MLAAATSARPPISATRPSVCIVVCMALRVCSSYGLPFSSTRGTASTVIASATESWIM